MKKSIFILMSVFLMSIFYVSQGSAEGKFGSSGADGLFATVKTTANDVDSMYAAHHENPCGKNPCGMNPCSKKEIKPIRKHKVTSESNNLKYGEKLWNDSSLGTSGLACASCHPGGEGLKEKPFPKYIEMAGDVLTKDQMINFCMKNPMKGKPLTWNSQKLTAIAAYVTANSKGGEVKNPCATKHNPCSKNPCGMNPCAMKHNPCSKNPCAMKHNPCSKNPCGMKH